MAPDAPVMEFEMMDTPPIKSDKYAVVVQLVEHQPSKLSVASSSLVYCSNMGESHSGNCSGLW